MNSIPKASLGLPVYNGERYIAAAIESVLSQSFKDYELIISDNASTDKTAEICRAYSNQDRRIRYYPSKKNLGAAWNFNRVFQLAEGEYFKWIAHDDLIAPDFLADCISVLEEDPSAVLCYPKTSIIDENGHVIGHYELKLATDSGNPLTRFQELLIGHKCFEIFGVIRTEALQPTPVLGNYGHADGVLLSRLSLSGRFVEISKYHLLARRHDQQSMNVYNVYVSHHPNYHAYTRWFDPQNKGNIILPNWKIVFEYLDTVWHSSITWREKIACDLYVAKWAWRKKRPLLNDIIIAGRDVLNRSRNFNGQEKV